MSRVFPPLKASGVAARIKCEHKPAFGGICVCRYMFVYFVEMAGYIKIGKSRDWRKRLEQFRTTSPFEIKILMVIVGDLELETELHSKFKDQHHRGEWFKDCKEIRDYIDGTLWSQRVENHKFSLRFDA